MQLPYRLHDIDTLTSFSYRHWISIFSPAGEYGEAVPIIGQLANFARAVAGSKNSQITRSHAYCVPYGDVQFAHSDFDTGTGITALYFANLVWKEEWASEMLFFGRSAEPEIAVAPKPGRVLIFQGDLRHRAGVPPRFCNDARFTLVVRLV